MKKTKNCLKNRRRLVWEGASSTIDISGSFFFNTHQAYTPNNNIRQVWINVGKYLGKSISQIESENRELINHE